jgi:MFS family permease
VTEIEAEATEAQLTSADPVSGLNQNHAKRSAIAGFFGGMLEYYDMSIYASASSLVFARIFFPDAGASALLLSLATFGIAYVARPLGGIISGHIGDRFGRRNVMIGTLLVMGLATFLIGCIPEYKSVGIAAPIMLVALRLIQGISVGGEVSGSVSLTLEHAPRSKRAYYASWQASGIWAGYIVASLVFLMVSALPREELLAWGWRIPFWSSAVIVVVGLIIRSKIKEPEIFAAAKAEGAVARAPLGVLFRSQPGDIVRVLLIALLISFGNIIMVFGLAYATSAAKIPSSTMLWILILGYAGCIVVQPFAAKLSDRLGRRPVLIVGNILGVPAVWLFFWAISTRNIPLIGLGTVLALSVAFGSVNVVHPVYFAELFNVKYRVTGMALGLQLGAVISGFAPTISQALAGQAGDIWWPACVFSAAASVISAIAVYFSRETFRTPLDQLGRKAEKTAQNMAFSTE